MRSVLISSFPNLRPLRQRPVAPPPPIFIGRTRPDQAGAARNGPELDRSSPDFDRNIPEGSRNSPEITSAEAIMITIKSGLDTYRTGIRTDWRARLHWERREYGSHRSFFRELGLSRIIEDHPGSSRIDWDHEPRWVLGLLCIQRRGPSASRRRAEAALRRAAKVEGRAHSKTCRNTPQPPHSRIVLDCGRPLPLFGGDVTG
jgi:hypothetical protein